MGKMYSHWPTAARAAIEKSTAHLPKEATLAERRKALHGAGAAFHSGTSHGKRVWGRECRAYYERHGQAPRKLIDGADPRLLPERVAKRLSDGDIAFPFREAT